MKNLKPLKKKSALLSSSVLVFSFLTVISIFLWVLLLRLIYFDDQQNLITHHYSIWGDWSAHFTFISTLTQEGWRSLLLDNPLFAQVPWQYPWLTHALTALLAKSSANDPTHLIQVTRYSSALILFFIPFALYLFFKSLLENPFQSALAVFVFLFLGGLQIFTDAGSPLPVTNSPQRGAFVTQMTLFELIPQRAFAFALMIVTLLISKMDLLNPIDLESTTAQKSKWIFFICVIALLPLTHIHSWLALGTYLLVYAFITSHKKKVVLFGLMSFILSCASLYFLLFRAPFPKEYQLTWKWFHLGFGDPPENWLWFWIKETSLLLPLAVYGSYLIFKKIPQPSEPLKAATLAGWLLWGLCNLFQFQPYYYDNLKLLTYSFLFLIPSALVALSSLNSKWISLAAIFLLTISGLHDFKYFWDQKQKVIFYTPEEIELAQKWIKIKHQYPSTFAFIEPLHHHWMPSLTGQPVFMGYPGWLWTWGINSQAREQELKNLLSHPTAPEWHKYENHILTLKKPHPSFQFPVLLESPHWSVFLIKPQAKSLVTQ